MLHSDAGKEARRWPPSPAQANEFAARGGKPPPSLPEQAPPAP
jgi:hypothetical protein